MARDKPPALARWLWTTFAPIRVRDDVLGDLGEEYERFKRPELGRVRAGWWYTHQILGTLFTFHTKYRRTVSHPATYHTAVDGPWSGFMNSFMQDVRYSARTLLKAPGFLLAAMTTLAIGIGANSAIFTVVNAVLLTPLPFEDPEELVVVGGHAGNASSADLSASGPEYRDFRDGTSSLSDLSAIYVVDANVTNGESPQRMSVALVTTNFFSMLHANPALGREVVEADAGVDIGYVTILSHGAWMRLYGGDPEVIGQVVRIDEDPITVIGVMPEGFTHPGANPGAPVEAWVPFDPTAATFGNRRSRPLDVIGRLADGVSLSESQAQFAALSEGLREAYPDVYGSTGEWAITVRPLLDDVVGNARATLMVLFGSVSFVLLIACTNVANLMLVRGNARSRELAIRSALGGGRVRLAQQLLVESVMLAVAGGVAGLTLAWLSVGVLARRVSHDLPRIESATIDVTVLLFTLGVVVAASLIFGLAPTWRLSKPDFRRVLAERSGGSGRPHSLMRDSLVVAQISVGLVLVVSAGLMVKTFARLLSVDPGFEPDQVLTMQVWLPRPNVPSQGRFFRAEQRIAMFERALDEMQALPEIAAAGIVSRLPFRGSSRTQFALAGTDNADVTERPVAELRIVSPTYFNVMGIPLTAGRHFSRDDGREARPVVIVNDALVSHSTINQSVVGTTLRLGRSDVAHEIAGVVGNVRHEALDVSPRPTVYVPYRQRPPRAMTFVLKTDAPIESAVRRATAALQSVDRDLPVFAVAPMTDVVGDTIAQRRILMFLLTLFAVQASLLAAVGVYGVVAYSARQRNREFGIRIAVGADRRAVFRIVVREGLRFGIIGVVAGLAVAAGVTHVLEGFLYDVGRLDPVVFGLVALATIGIATSAAMLPAHRATRLHPVEVLRED